MDPLFGFLQTDTRRKVESLEGQLWADAHGFYFFETSALSGEGINEMFQVKSTQNTKYLYVYMRTPQQELWYSYKFLKVGKALSINKKKQLSYFNFCLICILTLGKKKKSRGVKIRLHVA